MAVMTVNHRQNAHDADTRAELESQAQLSRQLGRLFIAHKQMLHASEYSY